MSAVIGASAGATAGADLGNGIAGALASFLVELMTYIKVIIWQAVMYIRQFLNWLTRDPDKAITTLVVIGALLGV
jgi:hypothetical protein